MIEESFELKGDRIELSQLYSVATVHNSPPLDLK